MNNFCNVKELNRDISKALEEYVIKNNLSYQELYWKHWLDFVKTDETMGFQVFDRIRKGPVYLNKSRISLNDLYALTDFCNLDLNEYWVG